MIRILSAATLLLCAFCNEVSAAKLHPECNVTMPCIAPYASSPEQVRITRGKYIARELGFGGPVVKVKKASKEIGPQTNKIRHKSRVLASKEITPSGNLQGKLAGSIAKPLRFIAGRLVCALNVGAALAERGIKGTGSALAHSYDRWGHASPPVPGAVAVSDRRGGGHVAIVSRVEGGRVFVWNATGGRKGWREVEYTNRRARYRVAGP